ncbi:iron uptake system protein EfeO [Gordonia sp. Z-3]|uniref:Peptidase M75 family protein n=1 Tax=Gordonia aquimaris TaxID=2984863 RepID=A0A9X3I3N7_9ACTN|nr:MULTISPECIES: iron uptake system protein EfeO [Gordonia]MAU80799.1 peptidase M75 family protein [Gordonia sp. (in: high G+C Gram-positive bacteria)]MCX2962639.1 peptidase M75 family protein [Gordonia aquimaris]MED5803597.1 iron uptake system protein EfeO [Gordonia sp. Z-3]
MNPRSSTAVVLLALTVSAPLLLAGCTSKAGSDGAIAVTSSNDACDLDGTDAQTGDVNFTVTNNGSKVTEFYVYGNNNRVLGEVENIGPGLSGNLTVEVTDPGTYTVACKPGMVGTGIREEITVSGEKKDKEEVPADVNAAKERYLDYVRGQVAGLAAQAQIYVDHIKAGQLDEARAMFGQVRTFYERVEPVAESFPDLDPAIDMRWDDTEGGEQPFTGFHRTERILWPPQAQEVGEGPGQIAPDDAADATANDDQAAADTAAGELLANINSLKDEVDKPDFTFETRQFVQGPQALIDEIAATKVGGEEDRYSHTDLWDFAANVDGAETLIAEMQPIISAKDQALMDRITAQFADVRTAIDQYREGDGYVTYTQVSDAERKELSNKIDALSATLSQVPGLVLS